MKYRVIGALVLVLLVGCQANGGDDGVVDGGYTPPAQPSARDADLAEQLARSYILYSDEFGAQYHPNFVRRIDAALCAADRYRVNGTAGWEVICWLALTDSAHPDDFLRRTVHPMSLFVADETSKVMVTD